MDPFVAVVIGQQALQTKVDKNGDMKPKWSDELKFEIDLNHDKFIEFIILEEDIGKDPDLVC